MSAETLVFLDSAFLVVHTALIFFQSLRLDLEEDSPIEPAEHLPYGGSLGCFRSLVRVRLLSLH